MNVLHLMVSGEIGGIEVLMKNYSSYSKHENIFLFLWNGGEIADEMKKDGKDVRVWNIKRSGMLRILRDTARLCRSEHIDAVVMHHNAPFFKLVILWLKLFGPKTATIAYKHDAEEEKVHNTRSVKEYVKVFIKKQIQKWGFSHADGIVAISEFVKASMAKQMHIPAEKIDVLYNGAPLTEFQSKERCTADTVRLIYVGRLIQDKGVQNIIPAIKQVSGKYPVTLDIVGDGLYKTELEKLAAQCGLQEEVRFCGACRDVPARLAKADIFIHVPECEEGFGITVVEAMAAGCLCVCAAKGGIPEIIRDGVDGILIPSASAEELAEVLERIIPEYLKGDYREIQNQAICRANEFSIQNYSGIFDRYIEEKCGMSNFAE